jgi:Domain of unknown function (DUF4177)
MTQPAYHPMAAQAAPPAPWNQGQAGAIPQQAVAARAPLSQYKVLTQKDRWFSGKFDPEKLEQALNAYAQDGWQLIMGATASIPALMSSNREELIFVLGRSV